MTWEVRLGIFDGPLDLLLYLIRREEIDISDIPIARVVEQYLNYIRHLRDEDIDQAGDFLVMAATLCGIKARILLPPPTASTDEEEVAADEADPRQELVGRLLAYSRYRQAGQLLSELEKSRELTFRRWQESNPDPPDRPVPAGSVAPHDLYEAFLRILRHREPVPREISADAVTVKQKISQLLSLFSEQPGPVRFSQLIESVASRLELIVTFVAMLELNRRCLVNVWQTEALGEINIQWRGTESAVIF